MYIKQIIIQGFKSYKEQTVIEPFSPGTNVIVGRNGSGKSNFFAAIRFVLSDSYTQMGREERQALLHEGSGSAVMSAYVEIIFDNSDGRFHTENKELVIRRTISLKKDEYAIDRRVVSSRNEVFSMLEMAGFSRNNPYYIVPQGRVTALTNMKEGDRLKLLKEIAGTESYEARRTESLRIMQDSINKRDKIDELLKDVKERLDELEEEKEELRGFQSKDRERRCLEYAYYHQQQVAFNNALEEIEKDRLNVEGSSESQKMFRKGEAKVSQLENRLHELLQSLELQKTERQQLEEDRREASRTQAKVELKVKSLADTQQAQDQAKQKHEADLAAVRAEIEAKEAELSKITPDYTKRKEKEAKVKLSLTTAETGRDRLLEKQSRGAQFKSKAERNNWLQAQINDINLQLGKHRAMLVSTEEAIKNRAAEKKRLEADSTSLKMELESWGERQMEVSEQLTLAKDTADRGKEERHALRRADESLHTKISNLRKEKEEAERKLSNVMDGATSRGLNTIAKLKRDGDIPGAYGMLADLMEVDEAYQVPVEQVAGNSLWHYVVDNADTGTMLLNTLDKQRGGRLTFMPLEQLRPRHVKFPRSSSEAEPLLGKIRYNAEHEKAFQHVFGKTLLCASLETAVKFSKSHGVDGITIDGDTTTKRGAMTGGYIDPSSSRLETVRAVHRLRDEYENLLEQSEDLRKQIELKDQEVTKAIGEVRRLEHEMFRLQESYEPKKEGLRQLERQLDSITDNLAESQQQREAIDMAMQGFGETVSANESEMATDFKKALSPQEEALLHSLAEQAGELQKQYNDCRRRRGELEKRKQMLESDLRHNLRRREDQITSQAFETTTAAAAGGSYADAKKELKKIRKRVAQLDVQLGENEAKMEASTSEIAKIEERKAQLEQQQEELAREIEKSQKRLEKGLQRKALLTQQLADCAKNIRDLGVLPEEAFEKYERMDAKKISTKLKAVNLALKKYKHVNKKAFDQYNSFTVQQEQLIKRRQELDSSQEAIEELVQHLDQKKDEAIERTFKQVSKEFSDVFEQLVPAGQGRLVIQRRADRMRQQQLGPAEDSDEERQRQSVENYTGVGISVSFNSKEFDEQQKIQQLSGGQKSLCALCLIFAIQRTEVSPMVVFDEVDANLDAQYRTAVASLLQSTSQEAGTQFIVTTFRPEIVQKADKCYGVTFTNKTSSIDCVPNSAALSFVEGVQKAAAAQ